jgi:hypothetical protein
VERLKQIKRGHEEREARRAGPVRLIPDPTRPAPKVLRVCMTGEALWQSVNGAYSVWPSWPDYLSDEQASAVDELLDDLKDNLDVASELSYKEGRQAARELGEYIKRLAALGVFVGVRDRQMLLIGGVGEASSWRGFEIQFQRASEAQLADVDGTPLVPGVGEDH